MGTADALLVRRGTGARPTGAASLGSQRVRLVDGALRCIGRQGVAKTTLEDVAREAGCSRATVYRAFPGGKEALLAAVVDTELSRFFTSLAVRMGEASDIEDVLVTGMHEAALRISTHEALAYLLENEPGVVLPHLAFNHLDNVLHISSTFIAPFLGRWLGHDEAQRVAEWAARIVISYIACPADEVDLTELQSVHHLVSTFVLPGVRVMGTDAHAAAPVSPLSTVSSVKSVKTTNHRLRSGKGEAQ